MRLAIGAVAVGLAAAGAHADARFASLHMDSVSCNVAESVGVSGEGGSSIGLSGSVGPVPGGAPRIFSLTFDLSFDSFSVPGDGFTSFVSLQPTFGSGTLAVTDFSMVSDLFAGATPVSHVDGIATTPVALGVGSSTTVTNFAFAYDTPGAPGFSFIGDNGTLTATIDFSWTGSSAGDTLSIDVLPGSSISYSFFIPSPGGGCVLALGALGLIRRRRAA